MIFISSKVLWFSIALLSPETTPFVICSGASRVAALSLQRSFGAIL